MWGKTLTPEQLESRNEKVVRFTRDVLGDPDRPDEFEDESPEELTADFAPGGSSS
jgi:hypothetical protein